MYNDKIIFMYNDDKNNLKVKKIIMYNDDNILFV